MRGRAKEKPAHGVDGTDHVRFFCGVDGGDEDPPDRAAGTSERVKAGEVGNACTLE